MITFILIFVVLLLAGAGWMIAKGATQKKRSGQSGMAEVRNEQDGGGAPSTGRATGVD